MTYITLHHVCTDAAGRRRRQLKPLVAALCLRRHRLLQPTIAWVYGLQDNRRIWRNRLQREQHDWLIFQLREDREKFLATVIAQGGGRHAHPWVHHPAGNPVAALS